MTKSIKTTVLFICSLIISLLLSISLVSANIAGYVVISEIQIEGDSENDDFIELYNPTVGDIDLSVDPYRIERATASGADPDILMRFGTALDGTYPGGVVIPAHGYYLIVKSNAKQELLDLADAIGGFTLTASNILYLGTGPISDTGDGDIIDFVGYGTVTDHEGTGPAPAPVAGQSIERKSASTHNENDGNGWDTNDNSADFQPRINPQPQNTASPEEPDITAPVTTDNAPSGWQNSDVTITLSCTDTNSGCSNTYYETDGTNPTIASASGTSVVLNTDGAYTIKYRSIDVAGNLEDVKTAANTVNIDKTQPTVVLSDDQADGIVKEAEVVIITAIFTESGSGIEEATVPKITIGGDVTNADMAKTSNLVWTYIWTVPAGSDGIVDVTIAATDVAGNTNVAATGQIAYTIDNIQPTVVLSDDQADAIVRDADSVIITATFTEVGSGIDETTKPKITIGGVVTNADMIKTINLVWTYTWDVPSGNDGAAAVSITAQDVAGNSNQAATGTTSYLIDNTPPLVSAGSDLVINVKTLQTGTASDPISDIATYAWTEVIGPGNVIFETPNAVSTNISADTDGIYTIRLTVTDNAGNSNSSDMTLTWDETAPWIVNPSTPDSPTTGESFRIRGKVTSDFVDISKISIDVEGDAVYSDDVIITKTSNRDWDFEYIISINSDAVGFKYSVNVTDILGNVNTWGQVIFVADNDAPLVTNLEQIVEWYNSNILVSVEVRDNVGVNKVFAIMEGISNTIVFPLDLTVLDTYERTLDITALPDGNYTLTINATDFDGNENSSVIVENINVDDTYPAMNDLGSNITNNITKSNVIVEFELDVLELNVDTVTLSAGTLRTMTPAGGNIYAYNGTAASLGSGCTGETTCTVTATVTDLAGNINTTDYSFRIDDLNPSITINTENPATMYNNDSVNITATISDLYLKEVKIYENSTGTNTSQPVVDSGNGVYSYVIPANRLDNMETVSYTFYAEDDEGNKFSKSREFTVENRIPIYNESAKIEDIIIIEGEEGTFNIKGSFYDLDVENLEYYYEDVTPPPSGSYQIDINNDTGEVKIIPINLDYFGDSFVTFWAVDPFGAKVSTNHSVKITYTNENDAPVKIKEISDVGFLEGGSDNSIFLNEYFRDPDGDPIFWSWQSPNENIIVTIDEITTQATISTTPDFYGETTLTLRANDGGLGGEAESTFKLSITGVNDPPVIDDISLTNESILNLTRQEDFGIFTFDLTPYETDVDLYDTDLNLTWSISSGTYESLVNITLNNVTDELTFRSIDDKFGNDTFILTLTDSFGETDTIELTVDIVSVNDPPVINTAPQIDPEMPTEYIVMEDTPRTIDLSPYESDADPYDKDVGVDNLIWTVTGFDESLMSIIVDEPSDQLIVTPVHDLSGTDDSVTLTLTDLAGETATINIRIIVEAVNDAPTIPVLTYPEDGATVVTESVTLTWNASIDVEGDIITYYIYHANESDNITFLDSTALLEYLIPNLNHENNYYWYVIAGDGDKNSTASPTFNYLVWLENAPNITEFSPEQTYLDMNEAGSQDFSITAVDVDDDIDKILWTKNGEALGEDSSITVSGLTVGTYNITVTVNDSHGLSDSHQWVLIVSNKPFTDNIYNGTIFEIPESALGTATGVTIEEPSYGSIDFGTNELDLRDVIDIDNSVIIGAGVVGIDTVRYSQLGEPSAHIIMKGLSFVTEPVIFYNEGFGAVGNNVCPLEICDKIQWDSENGILEFDVAHFSTFFTKTNNRPVANAGPDQNVDVDDTITLDGSGSYDPDVNDNLTYSWSQVSGPTVSFDSAAEKPTFTPTETGTYIFQLIVNDDIVDSLADEVTITAFGGVLEITKVRLESDGTNNRLKPGETLIVEIDIENKGEIDIENIKLEVWFEDSNGRKLKDDDNDVVEDDSNFDLDEGDDEGDVDDDDVIFEFEMPYDVEDGDEYVVYVRAVGEQGNDSSIKYMDIDISKTIKFEREKHELVIYKAVLNPDSVKCSRSVVLDIGVRDIGEKDEDDVRLTIINSELDVNVVDTFDIEEDADDNEFRSSYSFKVADEVAGGLYPLFIRLDYDDGDETVTETVNIEVEDCVRVIEVKEDVIVQRVVDVVAPPAVKEPVTKVTRISFTQTPEYMLVLALGVIMLTGMVIFLLGAVVIGFRKR